MPTPNSFDFTVELTQAAPDVVEKLGIRREKLRKRIIDNEALVLEFLEEGTVASHQKETMRLSG